MPRFILTSIRTGNELDVTYNERGLLWRIALDGKYTDEEHAAVWPLLPTTLDKMRELVVKGITVTEVHEDLSFDRFWNTYKEKQGKIPCEKRWNKLNDTDRIAILESIPKYDKWLLTKPGRAKKDALTYINPTNRYWEDDYTITKAR